MEARAATRRAAGFLLSLVANWLTQLSASAAPSCRRLIPHALLGLLVLVQPGAFASRTYYCLAAGGMGYMNLLNARRAAALLDSPAGKLHAH